MDLPYFQGLTFEKNENLVLGEYDGCIFKGFDWTEMDFSSFSFSDCTFLDCNFSLAKTFRTSFREVIFKGCKMVGLRFDDCNPFGLSFSFYGCTLNHSTFFQLKLKKVIFKDCQIQEVDFSEADLSESDFSDSRLTLSIFHRTNLERCDFRSASVFSIDPENNRIKGAKFSNSGLSGLLENYGLIIED
jgi:fluoroquinolone resistance protein